MSTIPKAWVCDPTSIPRELTSFDAWSAINSADYFANVIGATPLRIGNVNRSLSASKARSTLNSCIGLDQPNWDGDDALPISKKVVAEAQSLLSLLMLDSHPAPDVAPSADGSIGMEWWNGNARVFVDVGPEQLIRLYFNPGNGEPYEEEPIAWGQRNLMARVIYQLDLLYRSSRTETARAWSPGAA